ncbi:MAG: DUF420 domain-containing protein [Calditrichaceae bacterium]
MNVQDLPTLNAVLNSISAMFLILGYINIKKGRRDRHKRLMIIALTASLFFLISYLIYHANVGSVPYPYHDWTRPLYFIILIPHIILAAVQAPFIILAVWYALTGHFDKHKKLVHWVWPVWMFVSVSGVIIYFMLYQF